MRGGKRVDEEQATHVLTTEARTLLAIIADVRMLGRISQLEREELDEWVIRKDAAQN